VWVEGERDIEVVAPFEGVRYSYSVL